MICIPIISRNTPEAVEKIRKAEHLADIIEIRLDIMDSFYLKEILRSASKPVIVTYRSIEEGGNGCEPYNKRADYLSEAIDLGADFVDVEFSMPPELRQRIIRKRGKSRIIVSRHVTGNTPSGEELGNLLRDMTDTGTGIIKIVTMAVTMEDNLRVMKLIPTAGASGVDIIAFCMGRAGRISRVFSLLMGGFLTFASLERGQESAEGQITVDEIRKVLEILGNAY